MVVYAARGLSRRAQAYELLNHAAREVWGLSPLPRIERDNRGKPFFPDHPEYCFNLSHSGELALCALSTAPVGADIQRAAPRSAAMLRRACSEPERDWLAAQRDMAAAFALLWALKEALCKQRGTGLTLPISRISPPLPQAGETLLFRDGLWFRLYQGENWEGAVCGLCPPPEALIWTDLPG